MSSNTEEYDIISDVNITNKNSFVKKIEITPHCKKTIVIITYKDWRITILLNNKLKIERLINNNYVSIYRGKYKLFSNPFISYSIKEYNLEKYTDEYFEFIYDNLFFQIDKDMMIVYQDDVLIYTNQPLQY